MMLTSPLTPTYHGHIASTQDAFILLEASLQGRVSHVARRPHDRERQGLIVSGNVFIYEEHSSGIKRWTDGVVWSPSRILGNFLVYRELETPFPSGEKKRAMKRDKKSPEISNARESFLRSSSSSSLSTIANSHSFEQWNSSRAVEEDTRTLIGSLVDSYPFKDDGLVKKTINMKMGDISHHLISYYTIADIKAHKLSNPSNDPRFEGLVPRADLTTNQNWRAPIDGIDVVDLLDDRSQYRGFQYPRFTSEVSSRAINPHSVLFRKTSTRYTSNDKNDNSSSSNKSNSNGNANFFTHSSHPDMALSFEDLSDAAANSTSYSQYIPSSGIYPVSGTDTYDGLGVPRQSFTSVSIIYDVARSQLPSSDPSFARRASLYSQSNDAGMRFPNAVDSRMVAQAGMLSTYYGARNEPSCHHSYQVQRSFPNPSQNQVCERTGPSQYMSGVVGNMRNVSAGHGHCVSAGNWPTGSSKSHVCYAM